MHYEYLLPEATSNVRQAIKVMINLTGIGFHKEYIRLMNKLFRSGTSEWELCKNDDLDFYEVYDDGGENIIGGTWIKRAQDKTLKHELQIFLNT